MNSNTVFKLSGCGAVTNILLKPYTIAEEIVKPSDADLPLPRPAVNEIVDDIDFSLILSTSSINEVA